MIIYNIFTFLITTYSLSIYFLITRIEFRFVCNSPNTPGLRDWQKKEKLEELLTAVVAARDSLGHIKPPLLLKLSPDLSEIERSEIAKLILKEKV